MNLPLIDASKGQDIPTLNASEIPHAVNTKFTRTA